MASRSAVVHMSILLLVVVLAAGCRAPDPNVFDARLRGATMDAYVESIELESGAFALLGLKKGELSRRWRDQAVAAKTPYEFYRTITMMLADLNDPHVHLEVAASHAKWMASSPHRCMFLPVGPDLYVGYPEGRHPTVTATSPVLVPPEASPGAEALSPHERTRFEKLFATVDDSPFRWSRVLAIEGYPARRFQIAHMLMKGQLLTDVDVLIEDCSGGSTRIQLPRNTLVTAVDGQDKRIGPRAVAKIFGRSFDNTSIDPASPVVTTLPLFRKGECVRETKPRDDEWAPQVEAWRLGTVGYLRIGSLLGPGSGDSHGLVPPTFVQALDDVFAGLSDCDSLLVDLEANGGGHCTMAQALLWRLLPPEIELLPFEHLVWKTDKKFLGLITIHQPIRMLHRIQTREAPPFAGRIVVLVDRLTGSAAEITAATLRHQASAIIVGTRTQGAEYVVVSKTGLDGSRISFGGQGGMSRGADAFQTVGLEPDIKVPMFIEQIRTEGAIRAIGDHRRAVVAEGLRQLGVDPADWMHPGY